MTERLIKRGRDRATGQENIMLFTAGHDTVLRWFRGEPQSSEGHSTVRESLRTKDEPIMLGIGKKIRFDGCWGCGRGS